MTGCFNKAYCLEVLWEYFIIQLFQMWNSDQVLDLAKEPEDLV